MRTITCKEVKTVVPPEVWDNMSDEELDAVVAATEQALETMRANLQRKLMKKGLAGVLVTMETT